MHRSRVLAAATLAFAVLPAAAAQAAPKKLHSAVVCRRGCQFSSIQKAVNRVAKGGTVHVKPGTYVEGVTVAGHRKDGITIAGTRSAKRVVLQGKGARDAAGNPAQNGVFVDGADGVRLRNLSARNFPANGFMARDCTGYLMSHLRASFNRAYGLYAFNCKGGRMTHSTAWGQGDSGYYVGQTPFQSKPKRTRLDHLVAYENVLGYSGTNSKYVDITRSEFFNNGAGVAPNVLQSEKYAPSEDGTIKRNRIYWNNFNYFRADSPVKGLPAATGGFNYPIGVGVVLFGTTGWTVSDNDIFGNFKWGTLTVSDPSYAAATTIDNTIAGNRMGAANGDTNGADFMSEGSGHGNCYGNNGTGVTFDPGAQPVAQLYPACTTPRPANGIDGQQLGELAGYLTQGETQANSWVTHPHKPIAHRTPIDGMAG